MGKSIVFISGITVNNNIFIFFFLFFLYVFFFLFLLISFFFLVIHSLFSFSFSSLICWLVLPLMKLLFFFRIL